MKILYPSNWEYQIEEDADFIVTDILDWMETEIVVHERRAKNKANEYITCEDKRSSFAQLASTKKSASGVPLTKDELQKARNERDFWKQEAIQAKKDFNYSSRRVEALKKNVEYIKNLRK